MTKHFNCVRVFMATMFITLLLFTMKAQAQVVNLPITVDVNYGEASRFIDYMNQKRVEEGRAPYIIDSALMDAARQRCADLAIVFSHASPLCDNSNQVCNYIRNAEGYEPSGVGENILVGVSNAEGVYKTWRESEAYHAAPLLASTYKYCGCASVTYNHAVYWVLVTTSFPVGSPCSAGSGTSKWSTVVPTDSSYFHAYCYNNSIYYGEINNISEIRLVNRGDNTSSRGYTVPANLLTAVPRNTNIVSINQDGKIIPHNVGSTIVDVSIAGIKTGETSPVIIEVAPQASSIGRGSETFSMTATIEKSDYEYTGSEIRPKVSMIDCFGNKMQEGTDFMVEYENNIEPSSNALIRIYGLGNYSDGTSTYRIKTVRFSIYNPIIIEIDDPNSGNVSEDPTSGQISDEGQSESSQETDSKTFKVEIADGKTSYKYNETAITPAVKVYHSGDLVANSAYKVTYSNNKNVGTAKITVSGTGTFTGCSGSTTFKIVEPDKGTFQVKLASANMLYTGSALKPAVTVLVGTKTIPNSYYTVSYSNNTKIGKATVTVKGKTNYCGYSGSTTFSIVDGVFSVKLAKTSLAYNGKAQTPAVTVTAGSKTVANSNYTVSYSNNKNPGKATVTVKGKSSYDKYTGSASFVITGSFKVTLPKTSYYYNEKEIKPKPTVVSNVNNKTVDPQYYDITYSNNKKVGTATVAIKGKSTFANYSGKTTFTITNPPKRKFTKIEILNVPIEYNSLKMEVSPEYARPQINVYVGAKKIAAKNYKVTYKNYKQVGPATVTVTGRYDYYNYSISKNYYINPPKLKNVKAVNQSGGKMKVSWSKALFFPESYFTGYVVQYSPSSKFKNVNNYTIKNKKATSKVIKVGKGTFYVRVRMFRTINGKNYCGKWSSAVRINIKK